MVVYLGHAIFLIFWGKLCRVHEILSRAQDLLSRAHGIIYRAHETSSRAQDIISRARFISCARHNFYIYLSIPGMEVIYR